MHSGMFFFFPGWSWWPQTQRWRSCSTTASHVPWLFQKMGYKFLEWTWYKEVGWSRCVSTQTRWILQTPQICLQCDCEAPLIFLKPYCSLFLDCVFRRCPGLFWRMFCWLFAILENLFFVDHCWTLDELLPLLWSSFEVFQRKCLTLRQHCSNIGVVQWRMGTQNTAHEQPESFPK